MFRAFSKLIFKMIGWKIENDFYAAPEKFIIAVAPHTSNWDFIIGVLARSILQIKETKFLGKKELFDSAFGFIFRWLGGYPVDRSKNKNMVEAVVQIFNSKSRFSIALAPEGTRKRVEKIKTGFYFIAKNAGIPIYLTGFDYKKKKIVIDAPFYPTANEEKDFAYILNFYSNITGRFPEKGIKLK